MPVVSDRSAAAALVRRRRRTDYSSAALSTRAGDQPIAALAEAGQIGLQQAPTIEDILNILSGGPSEMDRRLVNTAQSASLAPLIGDAMAQARESAAARGLDLSSISGSLQARSITPLLLQSQGQAAGQLLQLPFQRGSALSQLRGQAVGELQNTSQLELQLRQIRNQEEERRRARKGGFFKKLLGAGLGKLAGAFLGPLGGVIGGAVGALGQQAGQAAGGALGQFLPGPSLQQTPTMGVDTFPDTNTFA